MYNMRDFVLNELLSNRRVIDLESVCCNIKPVLDLLLIAVAFILDTFQDVNSFHVLLLGFVDFDEDAAEFGIFNREELFAWCKLFHRCVAYGLALIVFEFGQLVSDHSGEHWLGVLDRCLFRDKLADESDAVRDGCVGQ